MVTDFVKQYATDDHFTSNRNSLEECRQLVDDLVDDEFNPRCLTVPCTMIGP
jgi:hypothetical protein